MARASTCSVMLEPPANIVGGSSTPFGRPVVPEVYIRLGRGGTSTGGSSVAACASHWSHGVSPGSSGQRQPMTSGTPACSAAASPVVTVSGPTKRAAAPESERM